MVLVWIMGVEVMGVDVMGVGAMGVGATGMAVMGPRIRFPVQQCPVTSRLHSSSSSKHMSFQGRTWKTAGESRPRRLPLEAISNDQ